MQILKHKIKSNGNPQTLLIPIDSKILSVQIQDDQLVMWTMGEVENQLTERTFQVCYTGKVYDSNNIAWGHVATIQWGDTVLHFFEHLNR